MAGDIENFEAELEPTVETGEPSSPEATSSPSPEATPSAATFIEAGGRKFKDVTELAKSYDGLLKDYTKTKQNFGRAQEWLDFDTYLRQNPDLRASLKGQIDSYVGRRGAGQSQNKAEAATGLPSQVAERIEALESQLEDFTLNREIETLQSKYSLDATALDKVLRTALKYKGLPLDAAYQIEMGQKNLVDAKATAEKEAQARLAQKQNANVGSSSVPNVTPSGKNPSQMNEVEYRSAIMKELEQYGV